MLHKFSVPLVLITLAGCGVDESGSTADTKQVGEIVQQALSHNREGDDRSALAAIDEALRLKPRDIDLIELKMNSLWNLFCEDESPDEILVFCDVQIKSKTGPEVMFRLRKAEVYQALGTRYEDDYRLVVTDREKCMAAIAELEIAIRLEPGIAIVAEEKG